GGPVLGVLVVRSSRSRRAVPGAHDRLVHRQEEVSTRTGGEQVVEFDPDRNRGPLFGDARILIFLDPVDPTLGDDGGAEIVRLGGAVGLDSTYEDILGKPVLDGKRNSREFVPQGVRAGPAR